MARSSKAASEEAETATGTTARQSGSAERDVDKSESASQPTPEEIAALRAALVDLAVEILSVLAEEREAQSSDEAARLAGQHGYLYQSPTYSSQPGDWVYDPHHHGRFLYGTGYQYGPGYPHGPAYPYGGGYPYGPGYPYGGGYPYAPGYVGY